ncbi:MAG: hypothetical protein JRG94_13425 [Deltaproteobacteria bacterium]|nr:hypothetical protein [Deltaproteobacteria bacterium]
MNSRMIVALLSATLFVLVLAYGSGAGVLSGCPDPDLDGVCDIAGDNCSSIPNPNQRDDDEDGYGNVCDWDHDQNCATGATDLSATFARLTNAAPWTPPREGVYDVDENGAVGATDLSAVFSHLTDPPGPSSRLCADCTATPGTGVCPGF